MLVYQRVAYSDPYRSSNVDEFPSNQAWSPGAKNHGLFRFSSFSVADFIHFFPLLEHPEQNARTGSIYHSTKMDLYFSRGLPFLISIFHLCTRAAHVNRAGETNHLASKGPSHRLRSAGDFHCSARDIISRGCDGNPVRTYIHIYIYNHILIYIYIPSGYFT